MIQRIKDWLLERQIVRLSRQCSEAMKAGDKAKARHFWHAMTDAIKSRSESELDRREARFVSSLDDSSRRIYEKHRVPPRAG